MTDSRVICRIIAVSDSMMASALLGRCSLIIFLGKGNNLKTKKKKREKERTVSEREREAEKRES